MDCACLSPKEECPPGTAAVAEGEGLARKLFSFGSFPAFGLGPCHAMPLDLLKSASCCAIGHSVLVQARPFPAHALSATTLLVQALCGSAALLAHLCQAPTASANQTPATSSDSSKAASNKPGHCSLMACNKRGLCRMDAALLPGPRANLDGDGGHKCAACLDSWHMRRCCCAWPPLSVPGDGASPQAMSCMVRNAPGNVLHGQKRPRQCPAWSETHEGHALPPLFLPRRPAAGLRTQCVGGAAIHCSSSEQACARIHGELWGKGGCRASVGPRGKASRNMWMGATCPDRHP